MQTGMFLMIAWKCLR